MPADHSGTLINSDETGFNTAKIRPKVFLFGAAQLLAVTSTPTQIEFDFNDAILVSVATPGQPAGGHYALDGLAETLTGFTIQIAPDTKGSKVNKGTN